jgi:hypothetical protein
MVGTIPIPKLHLEYRFWITELNFAKEEIEIFERHLEGLAANYRAIEVTAQIEHFQNSFIRHKEVIDILKHDLHGSEVQLASFVRELSGMGLHSIRMDNHGKLREQMTTFRKLYTELKNEFRRFEAAWY